MAQGRFITFEGIDGSGKTSVATFAAQEFSARGLPVVLTTEPTKAWTGEAVKRAQAEKLDPMAEALLFLADRARHTAEIRRWLSEEKHVFSDRYADSTYAYQAVSLEGVVENPLRWLQTISKPFVLTPDRTILLLAPAETCLSRISGRNRKTRFEELEFLRRVEANYVEMARARRWTRIDGNRALPEVTTDVVKALERALR